MDGPYDIDLRLQIAFDESNYPAPLSSSPSTAPASCYDDGPSFPLPVSELTFDDLLDMNYETDTIAPNSFADATLGGATATIAQYNPCDIYGNSHEPAGTTQSSGVPNNGPLRLWFEEHISWPYPSEEEMLSLIEASGKTKEQCRTWFVNQRARRRRAVRRLQAKSTQFEVFSGPRWLQSHGSSSAGPSTTGIHQFGSGRKGKRSFAASTSGNIPSVIALLVSDSPSKQYPCTFNYLLCQISFKDKHEWKRHEATHLPGMWICMPDGRPPVIEDRCAFCGLDDPNMSHFKTHYDIQECIEASNGNLDARSFAREDHLRNHINRVHLKLQRGSDNSSPRSRTSSDPGLLAAWYREPYDLALQHPEALWCGFCQIIFPTRTERVNHVGFHFQQGANLSDWASFN